MQMSKLILYRLCPKPLLDSAWILFKQALSRDNMHLDRTSYDAIRRCVKDVVNENYHRA